MNKYIFLAIAMILILAGCGGSKENKQPESLPIPVPIAVELTISPEHIEANTSVTISAKVTQNNENVENADEVLFEVWKKGHEEHEMIHGKHQGNGVFTIEKSFDADGVYYVVSHVTARNMHSMPKKEFIVGDAPDHHEPSKESDEEEHKHDD